LFLKIIQSCSGSWWCQEAGGVWHSEGVCDRICRNKKQQSTMAPVSKVCCSEMYLQLEEFCYCMDKWSWMMLFKDVVGNDGAVA